MTDDPSLKPAPADQVYNKGRPAPASADKIALTQDFAQDEERLLRKLDALSNEMRPTKVMVARGWPEEAFPKVEEETHVPTYDRRWIAVARTHFQEGFMSLNRAVFQPQRISLPEDVE